MFMADWIYEIKGFDPADKWRGAYSDEKECFRLVRDNCGLVNLINDALIPKDITPHIYEKPKVGDIGVIEYPDSILGLVGAILVNEGTWAFRSLGGIVISSDYKKRVSWSLS
jgi:hypothetical protein